jgi:hypothetical protein
VVSQIRHEVRPGDTVVVYPQDHVVLDQPDGFALFVSIVHGPAQPRNIYSDKIWVTGFVYQQQQGDWAREPIPLIISRHQPLVVWRRSTRTQRNRAQTPRRDPGDADPHARVTDKGHVYARVR